MAVWGDVACKKVIKVNKIVRGDWCPYKKRQLRTNSPCIHREERPCEDTERRQLSASQRERLGEKPPEAFRTMRYKLLSLKPHSR